MANFVTPRSKMPTAEALPPTRLFRSIHELPLRNFIRVLVDGEFQALVISGAPTQQEIVQAWESVIEQYSAAIAPKQMGSALSRMKSIAEKEARVHDMQCLLSVINVRPVKEAYDLLYTFGYPLPKLPFSPENLKKVLKVFMGHFKYEKIGLALQMEQDKPATGTAKAMYTWSYFEDMLAAIFVSMKLAPISIDSLTVGAYCSLVVQFQNHIKSMKKYKS